MNCSAEGKKGEGKKQCFYKCPTSHAAMWGEGEARRGHRKDLQLESKYTSQATFIPVRHM